jgi:hypothetical protein
MRLVGKAIPYFLSLPVPRYAATKPQQVELWGNHGSFEVHITGEGRRRGDEGRRVLGDVKQRKSVML